jgi:hypothetical protein
MMQKRVLIAVMCILSVGCATLNIAVTPSTDLTKVQSVYVKPFVCADEEVGEQMALATKIELMQEGFLLKDDPSADLIVEGIIQFSKGFQTFGGATIYGLDENEGIPVKNDTEKTTSAIDLSTRFIKSVSFSGKDSENNVLILGVFGQTSETMFWGRGEYPVEIIGREVGKKISLERRKQIEAQREAQEKIAEAQDAAAKEQEPEQENKAVEIFKKYLFIK